MRTPFDLDVVGKNLAHLPGVIQVLSGTSGSFSGTAAADGVPRLYIWRDGTRPLVVLVGKPWSSIFSLWRTEATRIGALMMALILFVLAVTLFLAREIGRRAQAEDKLEELATTDALTGLKNRRKFDTEIDTEWRRAARAKIPLALLMIDADHFKILQRHVRTSGRRSDAGRDRDLHFGFGQAGRRLRRALWRRGICRAAAGLLGTRTRWGWPKLSG